MTLSEIQVIIAHDIVKITEDVNHRESMVKGAKIVMYHLNESSRGYLDILDSFNKKSNRFELAPGIK